MQFKKMASALTLLLALSMTACSVGGGGGDSLPTATSTTTNNSNSNTNSNLAAEKTEVMKNSVSSFFNADSNAASYKYATNEAERLNLWNSIQDRKTNGKDVTVAIEKAGTNTAGCANAAGSECHRDVETGSIVLSHAQSYAGYAVIRETYGADDAPSNSYVYLVNTPTTNRTAVVDATYKGIASYSSKYNIAVQTRGDFTLNVSGDKVSGVMNNAPNSSGTVYKAVIFNDGTITANSAGVTFSGTATFAGRNFNGGATNPDLPGTYHGAFAGANAEEVAGVFETDDKSKEKSAQGAFSGIRQ